MRKAEAGSHMCTAGRLGRIESFRELLVDGIQFEFFSSLERVMGAEMSLWFQVALKTALGRLELLVAHIDLVLWI